MLRMRVCLGISIYPYVGIHPQLKQRQIGSQRQRERNRIIEKEIQRQNDRKMEMERQKEN